MKGLSFATVAFCLSTGYLISEPADNGNTPGGVGRARSREQRHPQAKPRHDEALGLVETERDLPCGAPAGFYGLLPANRCRRVSLLSAIRDGQSIAKAIRRAFEDSSASTEEQRSKLEEWLTVWSELGWLCPPAGLKRERLTR